MTTAYEKIIASIKTLQLGAIDTFITFFISPTFAGVLSSLKGLHLSLLAIFAFLEFIILPLETIKFVKTKNKTINIILSFAEKIVSGTISLAAGALLIAAVVVAVPILATVGGIVFTVGATISALFNAGMTAWHGYKWIREKDPAEKANYRHETIDSAVNAVACLGIALAAGLVTLAHHFLPIIGSVIGSVAAIGLIGYTIYDTFFAKKTADEQAELLSNSSEDKINNNDTQRLLAPDQKEITHELAAQNKSHIGAPLATNNDNHEKKKQERNCFSSLLIKLGIFSIDNDEKVAPQKEPLLESLPAITPKL